MIVGVVLCMFLIFGIVDNVIGFKMIEEVVVICDKVMLNFDKVVLFFVGFECDCLLIVVVVGGGFVGIEVFVELCLFVFLFVGKYF